MSTEAGELVAEGQYAERLPIEWSTFRWEGGPMSRSQKRAVKIYTAALKYGRVRGDQKGRFNEITGQDLCEQGMRDERPGVGNWSLRLQKWPSPWGKHAS